jgi:hypothetical protein
VAKTTTPVAIEAARMPYLVLNQLTWPLICLTSQTRDKISSFRVFRPTCGRHCTIKDKSIPETPTSKSTVDYT